MNGICVSFTYIAFLSSIFCESALHFASAYTDGRKLDGRVFDRLNDIGPRSCEKICSERITCKSYNYDLQRFVCELNSERKASINDPNLIHDADSVYNEKSDIQVSTTFWILIHVKEFYFLW